MAEGNRVFVGNITERVQKHELRGDFEKYGRVHDVFIGNGFGFITFDDARSANRAVDEMHGQNYAGERLRVEISYDNRRGGGRGRGIGGGGGRGRGRGGPPPPRHRGHSRERGGHRSPPPYGEHSRDRDRYESRDSRGGGPPPSSYDRHGGGREDYHHRDPLPRSHSPPPRGHPPPRDAAPRGRHEPRDVSPRGYPRDGPPHRGHPRDGGGREPPRHRSDSDRGYPREGPPRGHSGDYGRPRAMSPEPRRQYDSHSRPSDRERYDDGYDRRPEPRDKYRSRSRSPMQMRDPPSYSRELGLQLSIFSTIVEIVQFASQFIVSISHFLNLFFHNSFSKMHSLITPSRKLSSKLLPSILHPG